MKRSIPPTPRSTHRLATIYARYSTELQNKRSIEDQIAVCRKLAEEHGFFVVSTFTDPAISGSSILTRPGLLDLLEASKQGRFNIVICEALDRLSRDQEDVAHIFKRLRFRNIPIVTIAEGEVNSLHIGLNGTMNAVYIEELVRKTKRGMEGSVRVGKIPGGLSYGYRVKHGEPGERAIDDAEAEIVRRIFREYASGTTPLKIVELLNRDNIPGPCGRAWGQSTLNGSAARANGILHNSMYIGQLTWNRQRFIKNPETGKRESRLNPLELWQYAELPHLRIIDQELWDATKARQKRNSRRNPSYARHPKRVFSGLYECGDCGGPFVLRTRIHMGCSNRYERRTCDNARNVNVIDMEERILRGVKEQLLAPDVIRAAIEAYRNERAKLQRGELRQRRLLDRQLADITSRIRRLIRAIEEGAEMTPLIARLKDLQNQESEFRAELEALDDPAKVEMHPNIAARYAALVEHLQSALASGDPGAEEAFDLVRRLVRRIVVRCKPGRRTPYELEVYGDLAILTGQNETGTNARNFGELVAGVGFEPTTFRL